LVGYFLNATPGAPNATRGAGFAPDVQFSRVGGTFVSAFNLVLSTTDTNSEIRYVFLTSNVPQGRRLLPTSPPQIRRFIPVRFRSTKLCSCGPARSRSSRIISRPSRTESYVQLSPQAASFTSDLPILVIHNLAGGTVPSTTDQNAIVMIFEPANGCSSMTNPPALVHSRRYQYPRARNRRVSQIQLRRRNLG